MFTSKRLMQAYENAKVEYFDEDSKFVFFSDLHRGDDSVSDEFTRNQPLFLHALNHYYKDGYTYVEVGDGDELWEYRKFKHIRSAHSDIFSSLKRFFDDKRMIILYGNHNVCLKNEQYVKKYYHHYYDEYQQEAHPLFPGLVAQEALVLKERNSGQEFFVVHGHQGDLMNDQLWPLSMLTLRYFWRYLHVVGFRNPSSPARNIYKQHKVERNYQKWIALNKKALICGHTHRPRFPQKGDIPYFNTGSCIQTKGITGIEIVKGEIMLVQWRVHADEEGSLQIDRTVIKGPEPISNFRI